MRTATVVSNKLMEALGGTSRTSRSCLRQRLGDVRVWDREEGCCRISHQIQFSDQTLVDPVHGVHGLVVRDIVIETSYG